MSSFRILQRLLKRHKVILVVPYSYRLVIQRKLSNLKLLTFKPKPTPLHKSTQIKQHLIQQSRNISYHIKQRKTYSIMPSVSLFIAGIAGILLYTTMQSDLQHNNTHYVQAASWYEGNQYASKYRPTAVITGASSGIGGYLAQRLLSEKWNVVLIARSEDKMQMITSKYKSSEYLIIACDLSQEEECISACNKIIEWSAGRINLLVNNAATLHIARIEDETLENYKRCMTINVTAPFIFTKYLLPLLKEGTSNIFYDKYTATIVNI
eukprot:801198_1